MVRQLKFASALLLALLLHTTLWAQKVVLSGTVVDQKTGQTVAHASVSVPKMKVAVVTNDDGFFTLKVDRMPEQISVSHLGYNSKKVALAGMAHDNLRIGLSPNARVLGEVVVWTQNPEELVRIAMRRIPENYSKDAELFKCFYRETAMKHSRYIYVAEGVVDLYKSSYSRGSRRDRVAIAKGRRLLSPKKSDTLSVKVLGGPVMPVQLDIAKNPDLLLNEADLEAYAFTMLPPTTIDGREQFAIAISPQWTLPYALFYGTLYIDRQTLAFTRAELSLDMSDREKATASMLVRKPFGVRFRPKEMSFLVDYKLENGVSRISYVRNTFRFNCDWRRRLFATSFTAVCELVVTNRQDEVHTIAGRDSFDSRDAFYDKVDYFRDPDFWEDYNIIEPSESLDKAIGKLLKKYRH